MTDTDANTTTTETDGAADAPDVVDDVADVVEQNAFVELLGNRSRVRIFAALLDAPEPLNPHDIAESADISRDTFYNVFDPLLDYGVVEEAATAGNSTLYALAEDDELVKTLRKAADLAGAKRRE